jgi:hypothetical protein
VLKNLSQLTKPNCKQLGRNNDILPFEDANSVEFLGEKNECSLFAMGSHTKKRPNNLILVRVVLSTFSHNSCLMLSNFIREGYTTVTFSICLNLE